MAPSSTQPPGTEEARKKINPEASFDAAYWTAAAQAIDYSHKMHEQKVHLALLDYRETELEEGSACDTKAWWTTPEAHRLIGQLNASNYERPKRILYIHDTATGQDLFRCTITAAHLVPHSLEDDMLVTLFGDNVQGELDTPNNGLLLHQAVKKAMDDGVVAVVPDIVDNPSTEEVAVWENSGPKDYKWKIIDPKAQILYEVIEVNKEGLVNPMTIRDIENRKLSFKNSMRPRARYLYFLFALAQLKLAWIQEYRQDPKAVFEKQLGKGVWATRGRYLKRSFLFALDDEIGHDTQLAENVPIEPGVDDDTDPDDAGVLSLAKLLQFPEEESDSEN
ncbi:hypothetical protein ABKA04_005061 [Annulohypoxylon sp. FPYF3050]